MKKILYLFILFIIFSVTAVYTILFTNLGNKILIDYIEKKVNYGQTELEFKIKDFKLTTNYIEFNAFVNDNSKIKISGTFSLVKKNLNLLYFININNLAILKNLIEYKVKGSLNTDGIFILNNKESIIQGISDIAKSQTTYYIYLDDFNIKNLNIQVKNASIEDLLLLMDQPSYLKGDLDLTANIKDITKLNLDGTVISKISNGKINNDIINKEFKIAFSNLINFQADFQSILTPNNIQIKSNLNSPLGEIYINKMTVDLLTNKIYSEYNADIKNINFLSGIFNNKLIGKFTTSGNLEIFDNYVQLEGESDIFESNAKYKTIFNKFNLSSILFSIENGKLEKLLRMLNKPIYGTGDLYIKGDIKNIDISNKLDGFINLNFSNILIIEEVINIVFNQNIKDSIRLSLNINSKLIPNQAISEISIQKNQENLIVENIYNFKKENLLNDYLLSIFDVRTIFQQNNH